MSPAFFHGPHRLAAEGAASIGFGLILVAFATTLLAAVVRPQSPIIFAIALMEIATCCTTIRH
jgi:hypothetical protein